MADHHHPMPSDDALTSQLEAREAASKEDAAVLAPLRSLAAARALGLELPPSFLEEETLVLTDDPTGEERFAPPAPASPPPAAPVSWAPPAARPAPQPTATSAATPSPDELVEPPSPGPWPVPTPAAFDPDADDPSAPEHHHDPAPLHEPDSHPGTDGPVLPGYPPPGVVVPTGGPARVTTGVLAAAAAQRTQAARPVMELRPTVLATEIDRLGDQLMVLQDRLELRDRHNGLRRSLALADIIDVQVQRRLTTAVLVVTTRVATDMVIKGLRPEAAEAAREAILRLRPAKVHVVDPVDERALMRAIVELHRAGILDDVELAEKTAKVTRLAGRVGR